MKLRFGCVALAFLSVVLSLAAQTTNSKAVATTAQVPRLVKFSGTLRGVSSDSASNGVVLGTGVAPTSVVGITFSLYAEQSGGAALWSEVQNVHVDSAGHYTVQLGSSKPDGLPMDLFTSAQAQWLGVQQQGQAEQPRVMLLSVPYALKAADAETFGGQPPSAYAPASGSGNSSTARGSGGAQNLSASPHPLPISGSGTTNYIPLWTSASNLTSSVIYQAGNHNIGIGTTTPAAALEVETAGAFGVSGTMTSSSAGAAVIGMATSATGPTNGVTGTSASATGAGVAGNATATSGNNIGVYGNTASTTGYGVRGDATSANGVSYGVKGNAASTSGIGVVGVATATTGTPFGVQGYSVSPTGEGVDGLNTAASGTAYGVHGLSESSGGVGVDGEATSTTGNAYGVQGETDSSSGVGVIGAANSPTGASSGVAGQNASSSGIGVLGKASSSSGKTYGVNGNAASPDGFAVAGLNSATTGLAIGVDGQTNSNAGYAVAGSATSSTGDTFGVFGDTMSAEGVGVYGIGASPSTTGTTIRPIGVWGDTGDLSGGAAAVVGTADEAVAVAGYNNASNQATAEFKNETTRHDWAVVIGRGIYGSCIFDTSGNVACTGSKSAIVPVDGSSRHVALYAVEAPENWFEDVGSSRLSNGSAVVHLEPTFAQTVNSGMGYHVFLTPKGDCKGLYVTNETADSFEVRELGGGRTGIAFDYRIMARRKGYEEIRLADKTQVIKEVMAETSTPAARIAVPRPLALAGGTPAYPLRMGSYRPAQPAAYPVAEKK